MLSTAMGCSTRSSSHCLARLDPSEAVVGEYRARLATLGRRVRVERPDGLLVGHAVDIDDDGALVVRDDEGRDHRVVAADVVHTRAMIKDRGRGRRDR